MSRCGSETRPWLSKQASFPPDVKPWTCSVYVYVEDVDAVFQRALQLGAKQIAPVEDKPYQEREGGFFDSAGNTCWVATCKS